MRETLVSGTVEQRIAAVATEQRGRVARRQLLQAGVSAPSVDRLVAAGYLLREHSGVYAVGHVAEIPGGRETAAVLAARPGAILSHHTALRWWAIAGAAGASVDGDLEAALHLTVPGNGGGAPDGVVMHRSTILTERDLRIHDGLPVTSPARTLLDVAAEIQARELERALDTALVQRRVSIGQIRELLGRAGRHAGRPVLEDLLSAHTHTTFTRSEAEERLLALVRAADLSEPLVNVRRHGVEIDFLWVRPGRRDLAVEIDGYAFHASRASFERDRRRDERLRRAGVDTLRLTWRRLTGEPMSVVAALAAELVAPAQRP